MRDFYPDDMERQASVFNAWHTAARRFGFLEYGACVVESLDLLKRKAGEEITDQLYCFTDKSGRELALRAEMTPTLARMVAARQKTLTLPLKWYTIAQCFRYERMTRGRKREHYQWNLDVLGEENVSAELEVIAAAVEALSSLGIARALFRVRFSSRGLLSSILGRLGLPEKHHSAAFLALDKRGKQTDEQIQTHLTAAGLDGSAMEQVTRMLDVSSLDEALAMAGDDSPAAAQLRTFQDLAPAYGLEDVLFFDISVVRGLAYYTGIVFEAFDTTEGLRAIFGGGRYDNLLGDVGGKPMTGVGLGFGDVVLSEMLALTADPAPPRPSNSLAVGYMDDAQRTLAMSLAAAARRDGRNVDLGLHPERAKNFFARASKGSFAEAVYVGPDDAAAGTVRFKDLATRSEREIAIADILR